MSEANLFECCKHVFCYLRNVLFSTLSYLMSCFTVLVRGTSYRTIVHSEDAPSDNHTVSHCPRWFFSGVSFRKSYRDDIIVGGMNGPVNFSRPEGERLFYYYVPSTYTPNKSLPFIIYFHGYGGNWTQGVTFNQTVDAEANGYIIAFGQGTPSAEIRHSLGWNGGTCCLFNTTVPVDDVTYAKMIVRLASERVAIASNRVYAMGWSNGGYMVERLGCEAWDVFNGVGPDASAVVIGNGYEDGLARCDAAFKGGQIDYIHFHGTIDVTVPMDWWT